jgi:hypothetical protein
MAKSREKRLQAAREEYLAGREAYLRQIKVQENQMLSDRECRQHKQVLDALKAILDDYEKRGKHAPKEPVLAALKRMVVLYQSHYAEEMEADADARREALLLEKRVSK